MIQGDETFVKNNNKRALSQGNAFYWHAKAILGKLYLRWTKQDEERFPKFALFQNIKIQQRNILLDHSTFRQYYMSF